MANFRELTKQEKKLFDIFIKGYVEGLKAVSPIIKMKYVSTFLTPNEMREIAKKNVALDVCPDDIDIRASFKQKIMFFKRSKKNFEEYKKGFVSGYFRSLSSELPRAFLDPELNEDIKETLQNTWLYEKTYGCKEENNG